MTSERDLWRRMMGCYLNMRCRLMPQKQMSEQLGIKCKTKTLSRERLLSELIKMTKLKTMIEKGSMSSITMREVKIKQFGRSKRKQTSTYLGGTAHEKGFF